MPAYHLSITNIWSFFSLPNVHYASFCTNGKTATRHSFGKYLIRNKTKNKKKVSCTTIGNAPTQKMGTEMIQTKKAKTSIV